MYINLSAWECAKHLIGVFRREAEQDLPKLIRAGFLPPEDSKQWRAIQRRFAKTPRVEYEDAERIGYVPYAAFDIHWLLSRLDVHAVLVKRMRFAYPPGDAPVWSTDSTNPADYLGYYPINNEMYPPRYGMLAAKYFEADTPPVDLDEIIRKQEEAGL